MPCVFCEIAEGKRDRGRVFRKTRFSVSILDAHPLARGHSLVIPLKHYENLMEMPASERAALINDVAATQKLLFHAFGLQGMDLRQHYRPFLPESFLKVNHVHFHLLPRSLDDEIFTHATFKETRLRKKLGEKQAQSLVKKIRAAARMRGAPRMR